MHWSVVNQSHHAAHCVPRTYFFSNWNFVPSGGLPFQKRISKKLFLSSIPSTSACEVQRDGSPRWGWRVGKKSQPAPKPQLDVSKMATQTTVSPALDLTHVTSSCLSLANLFSQRGAGIARGSPGWQLGEVRLSRGLRPP